MSSAEIILNALRNSLEVIQGTEFKDTDSQRLDELVGLFQGITDEPDPEKASKALASAAVQLLRVCLGYPHIAATLFAEDDETLDKLIGESLLEVSIPPQRPIEEIRETAQRYYELSTTLQGAPEHGKEVNNAEPNSRNDR